jgi:hypothetical protein
MVCQNTVLASRTCDIVYDVVYDIVRFLDDIVRTTYDIARQKTYDIVRFLPVLASRTCDIVYDIVRFLTMSHTMCNATSVLYDIERKVPMSLAHIAKNIRYSATTSYAIS